MCYDCYACMVYSIVQRELSCHQIAKHADFDVNKIRKEKLFNFVAARAIHLEHMKPQAKFFHSLCHFNE